MSPTAIRSLTVQDLDIPLVESFGIAGGAQDIAHNLLVTIELENGVRGYGEAAPFPKFNGETRGSARIGLLAAEPLLIGRSVEAWSALAQDLKSSLPAVASARCALETAILDAWYRSLKQPLWTFFGSRCASLETDMTVTLQAGLDPAAAELHAAKSASAIAARGMRVIKTKVGGEVSTDLARVKAIHRAAPACGLLLDGNCGYAADEALELLDGLRGAGIVPVLFEQPVPQDDFDGLKRVSSEGAVPVAADESAANLEAVQALIAGRVVDVVNIKLMKSGVWEGVQIANACKAAGIGLMIGGMVESKLAMTVSACFAAGLGGFRFVDLDTPLFMAENPFQGGYRQEGARMYLDGITAGHGVTPRALS